MGIYATRAAGRCELCVGGPGAAAMGPEVEGRASWEAAGAAEGLSQHFGGRSMSVSSRVEVVALETMRTGKETVQVLVASVR